MKTIKRITQTNLLATLASTALVAGISFAAPKADQTTLKHFTPTQRQELKQYMQQQMNLYIMNNPKILITSLQKFQYEEQMKQIKQMSEGKKTAIKLHNQLTNSKISPTIGQGPVTIVEFFDYQCSACHMMFKVVEQLMAKNKNIRYVYKNFPIFGEASITAAKVSIAARMQGEKKFKAYHDAIFSSDLMEGKLKNSDVMSFAKKAGLNMTKLKKDMQLSAVKNEIKENEDLAKKLKLIGTPAFIITPTNPQNITEAAKTSFIPGGAPLEELQKDVDKIKN